MQIQTIPLLVTNLLFMLSVCLPVKGDDLADVKAGIAKHKLKPSGNAMTLMEESDFLKATEKSNDLRRDLFKSIKEVNQHSQIMEQGRQQSIALRAEQVRLNTALANVGPDQVLTNNKLVGALNALGGQINLLEEQRTQFEEKGKEIRAKMNEAREAYIQHLLMLRETADKLHTAYESKQADSDLKATIELASKVAKREYTFGMSPPCKIALKKLKSLEDTILSEEITLDRRGNTLFVSVVVNGKTESMVLDSGASSISLPYAMAVKLGVTPTESDPKVRVSLADGSVIEGHRKNLATVRVGKFTVNNVDCIVLGPDAIKAEPLLGMSFLGNFKFEVNADAKTLTMVKVTTDEPSGK
jgi:clan AA aspartic protease (TIGR02281 family)